MGGITKDLRKLIRQAEKEGWRVETRKNKVMFFPADKSAEVITVHLTPSDWRAMRNFVALLRRAGLDV